MVAILQYKDKFCQKKIVIFRVEKKSFLICEIKLSNIYIYYKFLSFIGWSMFFFVSLCLKISQNRRDSVFYLYP